MLRVLLVCGLAAAALAVDPETKARAIAAKMNVTELVVMAHGSPGPYVGNILGNARLGIPALHMNDGPQGFRAADFPGTTTQMPSGLTIAASFNPKSSLAWGQVMGKEFKGKGANIQLGPGICLARVPLNGRNFEYISGEDPKLGYVMVQPAVTGIQDAGVIANAKHYILNNQETNRHGVSANIDERTLMEMYAVPFWGAVKAGVWSVMCSYNLVNGIHACSNNETLNTILKGHFGYKGWVMTDWGAAITPLDTVEAALNGLDQEMPNDSFFGQDLINAVNNGSVPRPVMEDKVVRQLVAMISMGYMTVDDEGNILKTHEPITGANGLGNNVTTPEHRAVATQLAVDSAILLKNNGSLPIYLPTTTNILVAGRTCSTEAISGGGGSGAVYPSSIVTPLEGITKRFAPKSPMQPRSGKCSRMYPGVALQTREVMNVTATSAGDCCTQCSGSMHCNSWTYDSNAQKCYFQASFVPQQNGGKQYTSGSVDPALPAAGTDPLVTYVDGDDLAEAAKAAKAADVVITCVNTYSHEGADRVNLSYPDDQNMLVQTLAAANPNVIVVSSAPGATLMPWDANVNAILYMLMPGEGMGDAVASLIAGDVSPSGRLPITLPNKENEVQFTPAMYPGLPPDMPVNADYSEMLNVGYRWYLTNGVTPKYPFGHGLTYGNFEYLDLAINNATRTVSLTLENNGKMDASEVWQVYLQFPLSAGEPLHVLRGFGKELVKAGAKTTVSYTFDDQDLSIWDTDSHSWQVVSGAFFVKVGASVTDIRLEGTLTI